MVSVDSQLEDQLWLLKTFLNNCDEGTGIGCSRCQSSCHPQTFCRTGKGSFETSSFLSGILSENIIQHFIYVYPAIITTFVFIKLILKLIFPLIFCVESVEDVVHIVFFILPNLKCKKYCLTRSMDTRIPTRFVPAFAIVRFVHLNVQKSVDLN